MGNCGDFIAEMATNSYFTAEMGEVVKVVSNNYNELNNKPKIEGVELVGNKTFPDLGLNTITEQEIDNLIYGG